jgi:hypothetical protein
MQFFSCCINYWIFFFDHGRWFSPGTPASSISKTGRHDIAEILLKVALNTIKMFNVYIMIFSQVAFDKIQILNGQIV